VLWPYDEVAEHWDRLILRSHVLASGKSVLYQEGSVAALLHPLDLMERQSAFADGTLLFGGTLPAYGGVRATSEFAFELEDPLRNLQPNSIEFPLP